MVTASCGAPFTPPSPEPAAAPFADDDFADDALADDFAPDDLALDDFAPDDLAAEAFEADDLDAADAPFDADAFLPEAFALDELDDALAPSLSLAAWSLASTNLQKRLVLPDLVFSCSRRARSLSSKTLKKWSQSTSSNDGSFLPKSKRNSAPFRPSSTVSETTEGRPPRASAHALILSWSRVSSASLIAPSVMGRT